MNKQEAIEEIIKKSMQAYDDFKIQNVLFYGESET